MKGYTNLEQSRKLEVILPLESADLYYDISFDNEYHIQMPTNGYFGNNRFFIQFPEAVPCWSLASLLGVLPCASLHKTLIGWRCDYYNEEKKSFILGDLSDNPIDTCYKMILKLHELKML